MSQLFATFLLEDVNNWPIFIENRFINFELIFSSLTWTFLLNSIYLNFLNDLYSLLYLPIYFLYSLGFHHAGQ